MKKEEKKEESFVLTSTRHTKVNFKSLDKKLLSHIASGKDFWIATTAQIQIKQTAPPVPVSDAIDILVSLRSQAKKEEKKATKKKK